MFWCCFLSIHCYRIWSFTALLFNVVVFISFPYNFSEFFSFALSISLHNNSAQCSVSLFLSIYRCTCISDHLLVELSFQCNFISVFCEFFMSKCVLHSNDCRLHMRIGNSICMPIANLKNLLSRLIESYLFKQNWHKYFMCIIIRLNFTFLLWWLINPKFRLQCNDPFFRRLLPNTFEEC